MLTVCFSLSMCTSTLEVSSAFLTEGDCGEVEGVWLDFFYGDWNLSAESAVLVSGILIYIFCFGCSKVETVYFCCEEVLL